MSLRRTTRMLLLTPWLLAGCAISPSTVAECGREGCESERESREGEGDDAGLDDAELADAESDATPNEQAQDKGGKSALDGGLREAGTLEVLAPEPFVSRDPTRPGPYRVVVEYTVGPGGAFTLFRPAPLGEGRVRHPIVVWGNDRGTTPRTYTLFLEHLASHGFVVLASNGGDVDVSTGSALRTGLEWLLTQNEAPDSVLLRMLDTTQIGSAGHAQGAYGALALALDPQVKTVVPIQGASVRSAPPGSVFVVSGGRDAAARPSRDFFANLTAPAAFGELRAATHTSWYGAAASSEERVSLLDRLNSRDQPTATVDAGVPAQPPIQSAVTAWLRLELMQDESLRSWFTGSACKLCTDRAWEFQAKLR